MGHRHPQLTFGRCGGKLITPKDKLEAIAGVDFGVDLAHLISAKDVG
jgi:hypothetical protein